MSHLWPFADRWRRPLGSLALSLASVAGALLAAASARAQIVSDVVPLDRIVPVEEEVKADMDSARFRLGPIRLIPSIAVTNAGYDSNVFATSEDVVSDWTATFRAGARFLVPFGSKVYLRADAFPQYTWYADLAERRFFGGEYTGSLYGFFNRLSVELSSAYYERYRIFSSELDSRVFGKTTGGAGRIELEVSGPFSLYGTGDYSRIRFTQAGGPPDEDVTRNDRDQYAVGGGLRYRPSPSWSISAGAAQSWAEFVTTGAIRDNRSTAYLIGFAYNQPRLFVNLSGGYREGRADNGSAFPEYSTGVGSLFVSFFPIRWLEVRGYGQRSVGYSLSLINPYYFENRIGGAVNIEILARLLLKGFAETGPNNYPLPELVAGEPVKRRDEARIYGGGLSIKIVRNAVFTGTVSRSVYESNIPGAGRDYTRFTAFLGFGGQYVR